ncbi:MAG: ABC transporter ATP-binding protein/permease [Alphaproteobacteria bacterium]|nr:ABC transporter ATP-binding protein/permease [Alphaproteobacteria bacterium]
MKKLISKCKSFIKNDDKEAQIKWSLYGRVWREIGKPQWKWLLGGILATIVAAAAEAYTIVLIRQVIDQGFIEKSMSVMYIVGLQVIAAFGAKSIFGYAKTLLMAKAGLMAATGLRQRIYRHMVRLNIANFSASRTGELMNYYTVQAGAVLTLVTETIISMVHNSATILMMVILMFWFAPQMAAVLLFLVPAIIVPLIIIMRKKRKLSRKSFGIAADSSNHVNQTIQGIKTIQSFGTETDEIGKFRDIERASISNAYKQTQLAGIQSPLLEIMISVGLCLSLIVGGHFVTSGAISTGDFAAFILALTAAYQPVKKITGINGGIQTGLIASENLFRFLDAKSQITNSRGAVPIKSKKLRVALEDVHFAYNVADGEVLRGISLDVRPGQVCALVGPSGGGKSTVFNLIERFYDPQSGRVLIDNKDLRNYTLESLRKNIAIVSQDVFLFHGSIADNIKYGMPCATMEQIVAAATAANADEFIKELPHGYDTNVGERGTLLSGGQKQRIAIARAILKDAPILLLDEATSALDTQSEKLIQSALRGLMRGRTTFVIAHRLSTILDADIICVIKGGLIVERGTDKELVKMNGEYKKLKDIQFKEDKKKSPKKSSK